MPKKAFDNNGKDMGMSFEKAASTKNKNCKIWFWHGQPVVKGLLRYNIGPVFICLGEF